MTGMGRTLPMFESNIKYHPWVLLEQSVLQQIYAVTRKFSCGQQAERWLWKKEIGSVYWSHFIWPSNIEWDQRRQLFISGNEISFRSGQPTFFRWDGPSLLWDLRKVGGLKCLRAMRNRTTDFAALKKKSTFLHFVCFPTRTGLWRRRTLRHNKKKTCIYHAPYISLL